MAVITSASSDAAIAAAYLDNCGYLEDDDAAMAKKFVTACTAMLKRGIMVVNHGSERMEFSTEILEKLIREARRFVADKGGLSAGGAGVRAFDLRGFRD